MQYAKMMKPFYDKYVRPSGTDIDELIQAYLKEQGEE